MSQETAGNSFQIGDTVIIPATGQTGKVVAFENGQWKVKVDQGVELLKEASEIERRQILLG